MQNAPVTGMTGPRSRRRVFPGLSTRVLFFVLIATLPARAATDLPAICERAAAEAAQRTGVPLSVLKAISLNETGRNDHGVFRPWPWTVNMEGKGVWFDDEDAALAYVEKNYRRGARSFDVGCFQINYKWHGEHFTSIAQMFDPRANALYAAKFLKTLHAETGDWSKAAGAYHSRTPEYAQRYAARFDKFRGRLREEDLANIPQIPDVQLADAGAGGDAAPVPRVNRFPLLRAGGAGTLGSLVPIGSSSATPLLAVAESGDGTLRTRAREID